MNDYMDLVDAAEQCIEQLRPIREDQNALDEAANLMKQIRWAASYNHVFREQTIKTLENILDDMYIELNDGDDNE